jgi:hypothetical protein
MGYMIPQPFAAGENWSDPEFWVITSDPGYFTPTEVIAKFCQIPDLCQKIESAQIFVSAD